MLVTKSNPHLLLDPFYTDKPQPSQAVISQLGQLSLASPRGRLIEYQLRLG